MRADLNKLLCERERPRSGNHYKNYRRLRKFHPNDIGGEGEVLPSREGMKLRYGWDSKPFNENLNPLWGQVRNAVGRPWNKFYSELCQNFDKRSVINQHILIHLNQYVEQDLYVDEDGELIIKNKYRFEPLKGSTTEFYVDPRDGILKRNKHYKTYKQRWREGDEARSAEKAKTFRVIDDKNVLHLIDGVWYHFTLKPIPDGNVVYERPPYKDTFLVTINYNKQVTKTWNELSAEERQRFGRPVLKGNYAYDLFTQETLYKDKGRVYGAKNAYPGYKHPTGMYHATKQTASHKMLKKAGLV